MMNNIILNGVNSNTIQGLIIQELPPISKPAIRTEIEEIDGRDGDVITKLGYAAYDKEFSIGLYGDFDINEIIAFFNTSGTVTFSNEPDKYYNYEILNQIDFERLIRFRTATVTMHVQPFKYSTTEGQEELSGTVITAEGTNLNLVNTEANGSFTDLEIKGDTFQQTYSGKNLLNLSQISSGTYCGVPITCDDTFNLNGTTTVSGWIIPNTNTGITLPAGTYKANAFINSGSIALNNHGMSIEIRSSSTGLATLSITQLVSGGNIAQTMTLTESTTIYIRAYANSSGIVFNNTKLGIQIESGSTATSWEKYVGGTPSPNPDYPQDIKTITGNNTVTICGKNLFDKNNVNILNAKYGTGNLITADDNERMCYIPCKPNTTYTLYHLSTTSMRNSIGTTQIVPAIGVTMEDTVYSSTSPKTITTNANAKYIVWQFYAMNDTSHTLQEILDSVQIEVGSTATDYEAYTSQTYPISLGNIELCLINGAEDYIYKNNGTWYKHSVIGKYVFTGNESGSFISSNNSGYLFQTYDTFPLDNYSTNYFNNYSLPNSTSSGSNSGLGSYFYNGTYRIRVPSSIATTYNELKSWFETANNTIYYPLATPTDTEITDSTLLSQLNALGSATTYLGVTNIITSSDNLAPILYVETLAVDDPVLTVTNSGNTTAKPVMTLCGTGTVNLYLNGEQIFVINLNNDNYITIDVANMEAYYNGVLKNRLVTGNYENFILNQGENEITFTGTLYSMTISNYSRWI